MLAFVQIDGDTHTAEGEIALRSPGGTRLAIAARFTAEDALEIEGAGAFAALELIGALQISEAAQILRRRRVQAMEVGVISDGMPGEGMNDIGAAARAEDARLLADHFECGP